ncbi:hypothetical protein J4410_07255 [Candidatus Woesearchaeota archaeon]|nr:hypothetical protein [Candidatus Woesearchaeota archaeon]
MNDAEDIEEPIFQGIRQQGAKGRGTKRVNKAQFRVPPNAVGLLIKNNGSYAVLDIIDAREDSPQGRKQVVRSGSYMSRETAMTLAQDAETALREYLGEGVVIGVEQIPDPYDKARISVGVVLSGSTGELEKALRNIQSDGLRMIIDTYAPQRS